VGDLNTNTGALDRAYYTKDWNLSDDVP